jgi:hypothetical protein
MSAIIGNSVIQVVPDFKVAGSWEVAAWATCAGLAIAFAGRAFSRFQAGCLYRPTDFLLRFSTLGLLLGVLIFATRPTAREHQKRLAAVELIQKTNVYRSLSEGDTGIQMECMWPETEFLLTNSTGKSVLLRVKDGHVQQRLIGRNGEESWIEAD